MRVNVLNERLDNVAARQAQHGDEELGGRGWCPATQQTVRVQRDGALALSDLRLFLNHRLGDGVVATFVVPATSPSRCKGSHLSAQFRSCQPQSSARLASSHFELSKARKQHSG
jgi:hypothetical protein